MMQTYEECLAAWENVRFNQNISGNGVVGTVRSAQLESRQRGGQFVPTSLQSHHTTLNCSVGTQTSETAHCLRHELHAASDLRLQSFANQVPDPHITTDGHGRHIAVLISPEVQRTSVQSPILNNIQSHAGFPNSSSGPPYSLNNSVSTSTLPDPRHYIQCAHQSNIEQQHIHDSRNLQRVQWNTQRQEKNLQQSPYLVCHPSQAVFRAPTDYSCRQQQAPPPPITHLPIQPQQLYTQGFARPQLQVQQPYHGEWPSSQQQYPQATCQTSLNPPLRWDQKGKFRELDQFDRQQVQQQKQQEDTMLTSDSPGLVKLKDWYLASTELHEFARGLIPQPCQRTLAIGGTLSEGESRGKPYLSAAIVQVSGPHKLHASDGADITLQGYIDQDSSRVNGFPLEIVQQFQLGFPSSWQQLLREQMAATWSPRPRNNLPPPVEAGTGGTVAQAGSSHAHTPPGPALPETPRTAETSISGPKLPKESEAGLGSVEARAGALQGDATSMGLERHSLGTKSTTAVEPQPAAEPVAQMTDVHVTQAAGSIRMEVLGADGNGVHEQVVSLASAVERSPEGLEGVDLEGVDPEVELPVGGQQEVGHSIAARLAEGDGENSVARQGKERGRGDSVPHVEEALGAEAAAKDGSGTRLKSHGQERRQRKSPRKPGGAKVAPAVSLPASKVSTPQAGEATSQLAPQEPPLKSKKAEEKLEPVAKRGPVVHSPSRGGPSRCRKRPHPEPQAKQHPPTSSPLIKDFVASHGKGIQTTQRGRLVVPALNYWLNQSLVLDKDRSIVGIMNGTSGYMAVGPELFPPRPEGASTPAAKKAKSAPIARNSPPATSEATSSRPNWKKESAAPQKASQCDSGVEARGEGKTLHEIVANGCESRAGGGLKQKQKKLKRPNGEEAKESKIKELKLHRSGSIITRSKGKQDVASRGKVSKKRSRGDPGTVLPWWARDLLKDETEEHGGLHDQKRRIVQEPLPPGTASAPELEVEPVDPGAEHHTQEGREKKREQPSAAWTGAVTDKCIDIRPVEGTGGMKQRRGSLSGPQGAGEDYGARGGARGRHLPKHKRQVSGASPAKSKAPNIGLEIPWWARDVQQRGRLRPRSKLEEPPVLPPGQSRPSQLTQDDRSISELVQQPSLMSPYLESTPMSMKSVTKSVPIVIPKPTPREMCSPKSTQKSIAKATVNPVLRSSPRIGARKGLNARCDEVPRRRQVAASLEVDSLADERDVHTDAEQEQICPGEGGSAGTVKAITPVGHRRDVARTRRTPGKLPLKDQMPKQVSLHKSFPRRSLKSKGLPCGQYCEQKEPQPAEDSAHGASLPPSSLSAAQKGRKRSGRSRGSGQKEELAPATEDADKSVHDTSATAANQVPGTFLHEVEVQAAAIYSTLAPSPPSHQGQRHHMQHVIVQEDGEATTDADILDSTPTLSTGEARRELEHSYPPHKSMTLLAWAAVEQGQGPASLSQDCDEKIPGDKAVTHEVEHIEVGTKGGPTSPEKVGQPAHILAVSSKLTVTDSALSLAAQSIGPGPPCPPVTGRPGSGEGADGVSMCGIPAVVQEMARRDPLGTRRADGTLGTSPLPHVNSLMVEGERSLEATNSEETCPLAAALNLQALDMPGQHDKSHLPAGAPSVPALVPPVSLSGGQQLVPSYTSLREGALSLSRERVDTDFWGGRIRVSSIVGILRQVEESLLQQQDMMRGLGDGLNLRELNDSSLFPRADTEEGSPD